MRKARIFKVLLVLSLVFFFAYVEFTWNFNTYIFPYLDEGTTLTEVYALYQDFSAPIDEVNYAYTDVEEEDYDTAQSELLMHNVHIFNLDGELNDINPLENNLLPSGPVSLNTKELIAIFNLLLQNNVKLNEMGLRIKMDVVNQFDPQIYGLNIVTDSADYDLGINIIAKLSTSWFKQKLAFIADFFPDYFYIKSNNYFNIVDGQYTLLDSTLTVNDLNIERSSLILRVLERNLKLEEGTLNKYFLNDTVVEPFFEYVNLAKTYLNVDVTFEADQLNIVPGDATLSYADLKEYANEIFTSTSLQETLGISSDAFDKVAPTITSVVASTIGYTTTIDLEVHLNLTKLKTTLTALQNLVVPASVDVEIQFVFFCTSTYISLTSSNIQLKNVSASLSDTILNIVIPSFKIDGVSNVTQLEYKINSEIRKYLLEIPTFTGRKILVSSQGILLALRGY
ncbi:MAG: hypothetical protein AB7S44_03170 [Spirochaetales bacterium]